MNIAKLHPHNTQSIGKTAAWKLNQELLATVVRSNSRSGPTVIIEGRNYTLQSATFPQPGTLVKVKVVSSFPKLVLEFIDIFRNRIKAEAHPAIVLSAPLLQKTRQDGNSSAPSLWYLIKSFDHFVLQSFSAETLSLLNTLKKKFIKSRDLAKIGKLRSALRQSGLLLESTLASRKTRPKAAPLEFEADLKAILLRIFESLDGRAPVNSRGKTQANSLTEYSLSHYQDKEQPPGELRTQLKQSVEEELAGITQRQKNTLDEFSKGNQRWFFELLLSFPSRTISIPVTIYGDGNKGNELNNEPRWGAEFSLELKNNGFIYVRVNLVDMSVSVSLQSELSETAHSLTRHCDTLQAKLAASGLTLSAFSSDQWMVGRS